MFCAWRCSGDRLCVLISRTPNRLYFFVLACLLAALACSRSNGPLDYSHITPLPGFGPGTPAPDGAPAAVPGAPTAALVPASPPVAGVPSAPPRPTIDISLPPRPPASPSNPTRYSATIP